MVLLSSYWASCGLMSYCEENAVFFNKAISNCSMVWYNRICIEPPKLLFVRFCKEIDSCHHRSFSPSGTNDKLQGS